MAEPASPDSVGTADPSLSSSEVRRRAVRGVATVGARGMAIRVIGLGGNLAMARLLVPESFGAVAFAVALLSIFMFISDGGLVAGLIRRPASPAREDLEALLAVQIAVSVVVACVAAALAGVVGGLAAVTAVVLASLPVLALRGPALVTLERQLAYRPIAAVEVGEVFAYHMWAVGTVVAGLGVWGFASASIVKAVVGTAVLLRRCPDAPRRPVLSVARTRSLLAFGLRFQVVRGASAAREHGMSVGLAAIAGTATVGFYALAWRVLQVPMLLFETLWRVSFAAMAQLLAAGDDARPVVERAAGAAATAVGLVLTALAVSAPAAVPALFGEQWTPTADVIPLACLALQIGGPVSVATAGYLFASGQGGTVVRAALGQAVIALAVSFSLVPVMGVAAVGVGWIAGAVWEALVLLRVSATALQARVGHAVAPALVVALTAGSTGWFVTSSMLEPTLLVAAVGALAGAAVYVAGLAIVRPALLRDLTALFHTVTRRA